MSLRKGPLRGVLSSLKKPLITFFLVLAVVVAGALAFVQSTYFAQFTKRTVARLIPGDLGLDGDFSDFSLTLLPPGIAVNRPSVRLRERNILGLPGGSRVSAERIRLIFTLFQSLSGYIPIDRVVIEGGEVDLQISAEKQREREKQKKESLLDSWMQGRLGLHWEDLLRVRAQSVELENTRVRLELQDSDIRFNIDARALRLTRSEGSSGVSLQPPRNALISGGKAVGWLMSLDLGALQIQLPSRMLPGWLGSVRRSRSDSPGKPPGALRDDFAILEGFSQVRADAFIDTAGVRLDRLAFERNGLGVDIRGSVAGDLLVPTGEPLEVRLRSELKGDLQRILSEVYPADSKVTLGGGAIHLQADIEGDLLKLADTARVEGMLAGRNVFWGPWRADQIQFEGGWAAARGTDFGVLSVKELLVQSEEKPRVREREAAQGGRIRVGAFKWQIGSSESLALPIDLENAHIHWLAAVAHKQVWPLDFRISGDLDARLRLPDSKSAKSWELQAGVKLGIPRFRLDNQKMGRIKELTTILDVTDVKLVGGVRVDSLGIHPAGLALKLPKSSVAVTGGVSFQKGFDLDVRGPINLADIGTLAESPIRGEGEIAVRVHGPSARMIIDFDPDLRNASYLQLKFGAIKGRISYDEDPQHLFIRKVGARQRSLEYVVDGMLDLGDAETLELEADIDRGDVNDLIEVVSNLVSDIWWFPRTLIGPMKGAIRLSGGLSLERLQVNGRIGGSGWSFLGESFKDVALRGGYDKGKYLIDELRANKKAGRFRGRISYHEKDGIDWNLRTESFSMSDIDAIARLDVPIRGRMALTSSGKGRFGSIAADTRLQVFEAGVRGVAVPPSELSIRSGEGVTRVEGIALGGQGEIEASIDAREGKPAFVRLDLRSLDFSPLLLILNSSLIQDKELRGLISGGLDLSFLSGQLDRATGKVGLSQLEIARKGICFNLVEPVQAIVDKGDFLLEKVALRSSNGLDAWLGLAAENTRLEGLVGGHIDLGILEFLTSSIERARGALRLDLGVSGRTLEPTLSGRAVVEEAGGAEWLAPSASIKVASLDTPVENITGAIQVRQGLLTLSKFGGELAGGGITASGTAELFPDKWPTLDIDAQLSGNKIKVWPFQYAKVRGGLKVSGTTVPWRVSGTVEVDEALSKEKLTSGKSSGGAGELARYAPPPGSGADTSFPKFMLDIAVKAPGNVFIRNDLFDVEMIADVRIINSLENPRIMGATRVLKGNMLFRERSFQIQNAAVEFDNPAVMDPRLSMAGYADISGTRVNLGVSGRLSSYKIDLTSNPVLPEPEILSLLALGFTSGDIQRLKTGDRSTIEQSEAASLVLHSTDFNRDLESKTGLRLQVDEAVATGVGSSIFRPSSQNEAGVAPKIVVKRQIGKRVDVSVGSTVGVGTNSQQEVNAEFKVSPSVSVIGVWDTNESVTTNAQQSRTTSYGVDLKVQKRFK